MDSDSDMGSISSKDKGKKGSKLDTRHPVSKRKGDKAVNWPGTAPWLDIGDDILQSILLQLPATDIGYCAQVCKKFQTLAGDRYLWQLLCLRDGKVTSADVESDPDADWQELYLKPV